MKLEDIVKSAVIGLLITNEGEPKTTGPHLDLIKKSRMPLAPGQIEFKLILRVFGGGSLELFSMPERCQVVHDCQPSQIAYI